MRSSGVWMWTNVSDLKTMPAADVVIDFSHPAMLPALAEYVKRNRGRLW